MASSHDNDPVGSRARLLEEGRAAFNAGDFFLAHERWEEVWRHAVGDDRRWLQGLIQVAAGSHQLARGRTGPAARLLARAVSKLADAPDRLDGLDLDAARRGATRTIEAIARGEPALPGGIAL